MGLSKNGNFHCGKLQTEMPKTSSLNL